MTTPVKTIWKAVMAGRYNVVLQGLQLVAVGIGVVGFCVELSDRADERRTLMWERATAADNSVGATPALEYLNQRGESFFRVDLSNRVLLGVNFEGADLVCARLDRAELRPRPDVRADSPSDKRSYLQHFANLFDAASDPQEETNALYVDNCASIELLTGIGVTASSLRDAVLDGASLKGTSLTCADLEGARLIYTDLRGADLRGANLRNTDLSGADLRDADLRFADLRNANLANTRRDGDQLSSKQKREAAGLDIKIDRSVRTWNCVTTSAHRS